MQNISANEAWLAFVVVVVVLSAVLGVVEKIISIKKKVKEPEELQDNKLNELEDRIKKVEYKLKDAEKHSDKIDDGIYVLMLGSLALLDHGLDGNNIEAMSEAKKEIQKHLAKNNN
ncbi:MAG: hypothetical protein E7532_08350 [Ruminococcaceae bacterium]|nr:hypothetical protein [Oscillospiraceae bacterium]